MGTMGIKTKTFSRLAFGRRNSILPLRLARIWIATTHCRFVSEPFPKFVTLQLRPHLIKSTAIYRLVHRLRDEALAEFLDVVLTLGHNPLRATVCPPFCMLTMFRRPWCSESPS